MDLFDTHFHLYPEDNLSLLLKEARQASVNWLTAVAVDLENARQMIAMINAFGDKRLLTTVGVHPHEAIRYQSLRESRVQNLASSPAVKAIGEIGLDYHYNHSPPDLQRKVFRQLLLLAAEMTLPVVIHCREAYDDCFRIIQETEAAKRSRLLLHSYTGNPQWVQRFSREFDCWFSFNGIVTFKKADNVRASLAAVPDHRLLLETDAPYLAPVPFRGKRNQPAWLPYIAEFVAGQRNRPLEQLAQLTTANARQFFAV